MEPGRLIAGRHPCAWGPDGASAEVRELADAGVTLFLDLTTRGELEPYASHVAPPARYVNRPIRDFSIPSRDALVATLDEIDAEIESGGLVYVHCWAGCGRTGVVVGVVDTGIDIYHHAFRLDNGKTRILALLDLCACRSCAFRSWAFRSWAFRSWAFRSACCRNSHAPAPAGSRTKIVLRS